ncbi:hypothetical protein Salat_1382100 [Sesamum alatum]|uniref:Uncharacterized protein n=1 Tax=Sesamum alatum TaxID=300844 RepID=A0AAE1YAC5_9LAMI|nr:hypothetical protein Salat_1382100 [Sesamum alatum]
MRRVLRYASVGLISRGYDSSGIHALPPTQIYLHALMKVQRSNIASSRQKTAASTLLFNLFEFIFLPWLFLNEYSSDFLLITHKFIITARILGARILGIYSDVPRPCLASQYSATIEFYWYAFLVGYSPVHCRWVISGTKGVLQLLKVAIRRQHYLFNSLCFPVEGIQFLYLEDTQSYGDSGACVAEKWKAVCCKGRKTGAQF